MTERNRVFRGDRLKKIRDERELSQSALAEMLGFGQNQIYRYETGLSEPSPDVLVRLAKELGVTADYLLGLTDDPKGHLEEEALSPMERKLIAALRSGRLVEALDVVTELAKSGS